jgi:hypothetical protein
MAPGPMSLLAYGYDLGGTREGWYFDQRDENERVAPWFAGDTETDLSDHVEWRLRSLLRGASDTDLATERAGREALDRVGIIVDLHGDADMPSYVLAAHIVVAEWQVPHDVDLAGLERRRRTEGWDTGLATALKALAINPHQQGPRWLLLTFGGSLREPVPNDSGKEDGGQMPVARRRRPALVRVAAPFTRKVSEVKHLFDEHGASDTRAVTRRLVTLLL